MYFTKAQIRALWFVVMIFAAAVLLHYAKIYLFSQPACDFSEFERLFEQKRDSLLQIQQEDSATSLHAAVPNHSSKNSSNTTITIQFPININTANIKQLELLPRIGPKMAKRILNYRQEFGPFKTKEEIMKVKGIGKNTFARFKDLIVIK